MARGSAIVLSVPAVWSVSGSPSSPSEAAAAAIAGNVVDANCSVFHQHARASPPPPASSSAQNSAASANRACTSARNAGGSGNGRQPAGAS